MSACSPRGRPPVWRESTRTLLGTFVTVAVDSAADPANADVLLDMAFGVIGHVHARMSFHDPGSDLARLNKAAAGEIVHVDAETFAVLRLAGDIARASEGVFDVTVAPALVAAGRLPVPPGPAADPAARWTDLVLESPDRVRVLRHLWLDLGGIAKGHAVDLAAEALREAGVTAFRINAGGDLRVGGGEPQPVVLAVPELDAAARPVIELCEGSLASSAVVAGPAAAGAATAGAAAHLDGRTRKAAGHGRFVSVVAPQCALADALTKVVLALGPAASPILAGFGATAYLYAPAEGWQTLGGERST